MVTAAMKTAYQQDSKLVVLPKGGYEYDGVPMRRVTEILKVIANPKIEEIKRKSLRAVCHSVAQRVVEEVFDGTLTDRTQIEINLNDDTAEAAKRFSFDFRKAEAGIRIHAYVAYKLGNQSPQAFKSWEGMDATERLKGTQILQWLAEHNFNAEAIEETICTPKDLVAGTIDLRGLIDWEGEREEVIVDYKTGYGFWPTYDLQLTGYMDMLNILHCRQAFGLLLRPLGDKGAGCEYRKVPYLGTEGILLYEKWRAALRLAA